MRGRAIVWLVLLPLVACGGASEEAPGPESAAGAEEAGPPGPAWDQVQGSAYEFYKSVARTLLRTNQPLRASRNIRKMFKLKPDSPEPYYLMARAYVGMREYGSALKMLGGAIEKDEEYAQAHSMMGVVLNMTGRHHGADKAHARALELDPESAAFHNNQGFSSYLQGRHREAIAAYRRALERDAGSRRIHNNLGFAYGKLGDLETAHRHFKLAGLPAQASNNMGFVHESRGDDDNAYAYYLLSLQQDPALRQARRNLERVCGRLGRPMPEIGVNNNKDGIVVVEAADPADGSVASVDDESDDETPGVVGATAAGGGASP